MPGKVLQGADKSVSESGCLETAAVHAVAVSERSRKEHARGGCFSREVMRTSSSPFLFNYIIIVWVATVPGDAIVAFLKSNWGNLVTVLGFIVTILTILRAKTAAVSARQAAEATKAQLSRVNTLDEFSSAIAIMDEIKRLHRAGAWELVPDRYSVLRRLLASIQTLKPGPYR